MLCSWTNHQACLVLCLRWVVVGGCGSECWVVVKGGNKLVWDVSVGVLKECYVKVFVELCNVELFIWFFCVNLMFVSCFCRSKRHSHHFVMFSPPSCTPPFSSSTLSLFEGFSMEAEFHRIHFHLKYVFSKPSNWCSTSSPQHPQRSAFPFFWAIYFPKWK